MGKISFEMASATGATKSKRLQYIAQHAYEIKAKVIKSAMKDLGFPLETSFKTTKRTYAPNGSNFVLSTSTRLLEPEQEEAVKEHIAIIEEIEGIVTKMNMCAVRLLNKSENKWEEVLVVHGIHNNMLPKTMLEECHAQSRPEFVADTNFKTLHCLSLEIDTLFFLHGGMV